jgi:MATE family multidrug resistance protein
VRPATAVTLVALALAPVYSWLFIFKLDWRLDGAALAVDAVQVGQHILGMARSMRRWRSACYF